MHLCELLVKGFHIIDKSGELGQGVIEHRSKVCRPDAALGLSLAQALEPLEELIKCGLNGGGTTNLPDGPDIKCELCELRVKHLG